MNILVTAGNTQVFIDRVRCITNIFTGRTGASIAQCAAERGHRVSLLTSHPETIQPMNNLCIHAYRSFDDLRELMREGIGPDLNCIVHCAAVSDYESGGIFAPAPGTQFNAESSTWQSADGVPQLRDRSAGKVKSDQPELWLRLIRTPKLVDFIRGDWGFSGVLVKFKLEVGISEMELHAVAEKSRQQSAADLMVANTLEGASDWALLGPVNGTYQRIERGDLAAKLLDEIEKHHRERHG